MWKLIHSNVGFNGTEKDIKWLGKDFLSYKMTTTDNLQDQDVEHGTEDDHFIFE
jgi:hypothetical protein